MVIGDGWTAPGQHAPVAKTPLEISAHVPLRIITTAIIIIIIIIRIDITSRASQSEYASERAVGGPTKIYPGCP
eukprot:COSAG05_NODE_97_length_19444_cov_8.577174_19_plen_74_part_00